MHKKPGLLRRNGGRREKRGKGTAVQKNELLRKGGENMWRILEFWREEDAVGVVEIILILVVLIGLVIIFKEQLVSLVNNILDKITNQSNSI